MSKDNTLDERIEAAIFQGFAVRDLDETGQDQELDFNRSIEAIKSLIAEERRKAKIEQVSEWIDAAHLVHNDTEETYIPVTTLMKERIELELGRGDD